MEGTFFFCLGLSAVRCERGGRSYRARRVYFRQPMEYRKNETSIETAKASLEDLAERIEGVPGYKPGGALSRLADALLDIVNACSDETIIGACDVFYDPGLTLKEE